MAGCQRHLVQLAYVPSGDDDAARIGVVLDLFDSHFDLVDDATVYGLPRAPLLAIYRPKVAVLVGPLVPDADAVVLEVFGVGAALQEPQQFMDDGFEVALLGGDQRKTFGEIETHLIAEHAGRASAGAVGFVGPVRLDVLHQI